MLHEPYANLRVGQYLVQADERRDLSGGGSRKRSRGAVEESNRQDLFRALVMGMHNDGTYETCRALLLGNFYTVLAINEGHDLYDDMCQIVLQFRAILKQAEQLLYKGYDMEVFYLLHDNLSQLLHNAQQPVLIFTLGATQPLQT